MHDRHIHLWQHAHTFNSEKRSSEIKTLIVIAITVLTMIAEILYGWISNSMALLADGWHMGTHAAALSISYAAYVLARRYARDHKFTFGTWKIEILGAYSSAIVLGLVGLIMIFTSVQRMLHPLTIHFNQALLVAGIGLIINVLSAFILSADHHSDTHSHTHDDHTHTHSPSHTPADHSHEHDESTDLNLRSAYLHVVADALTSVLAILALLGAKYLNFVWLDPLMGIIGAGLIMRWAVYLLKDSSNILLDHETDSPLRAIIKQKIESDGDSTISDLHIWLVGPDKYACIVALVTSTQHSIDEFKQRLNDIHELVHITVELNHCKYCYEV